MSDHEQEPVSPLSMGIALGMLGGVVLGLLLDQLGLFLPFGMLFGVVAGLLVQRSRDRQGDPGDPPAGAS